MNMMIGGIDMIKKKNFVDLMMAIQKHDEFENAINKVFRDYDCDSSIMCCDLEGAIVRFLQNEFEDDDDWIGYFCYDMNYLKDFEIGNIILKDGTMPNIDTWEKAYDFLIDCMNEKK